MNAVLRPVSALAGSSAARPRIARTEIIQDMAAAEPYWRALEGTRPLATPYQRFEFLATWQRHVGAAQGVTPLIVVGLDEAGAPLMLCPFGRRTFAGFRIAEFLGGKHANFNMPLWRADFAASAGADALRAALTQIVPHADALLLLSQPFAWAGNPNPLASLPHQRSADSGFSGPLISDFEALLHECASSSKRKKMRKKERALADAAGTVQFLRTEDAAMRKRILDVFFEQKQERMRLRGVIDSFSEAEVRRFVDDAASSLLADGRPLVELCALTAGDTIVATFAGMTAGGRYCGMFTSMIEGPLAAHSPGEQLLQQLVRDCCERGITRFDLGVGGAQYKGNFCPDIEPLFDSFLPLTPAGRLLAIVASSGAAAKRTIKQSPALWSLVQAIRRLRAKIQA